jgi:hypothetical protein
MNATKTYIPSVTKTFRPSVDYLSYPECDVILDHVIDRFKKGLYTLTLVIGLPGTGKSSTCLRLAELTKIRMNKLRMERGQEPNNNPVVIVDSLIKILEWLQKAQEGDIVAIEELSVLFPARRSMAIENVAIGRVLDTCRKKMVILYSNAPIFASIDSHIRAMANILIETLKIVRTQGVVVSKALRLQTNPGSGKTYYHKFKRNGRDVLRIYTRKPDEKVWKEYEEEKDRFMIELYLELKAKAEKKKGKDMGFVTNAINERFIDYRKPLSEPQREAMVLVAEHGYQKAADILGIGLHAVAGRVGFAKRKGYDLKEFIKVEEESIKEGILPL